MILKKMTHIDHLVHFLEDLIKMEDPEDHEYAIDCPHIPGVYNAVKFMCDGLF